MSTLKLTTSPRRRLLIALFTVGLTLIAPVSQAHDADEETIAPVMKQDLPQNPGDHVLLATVSYAPGQASKAHLHAGPIFAYVLERHVTSQLGDGPIITYGPGESWYEAPGTQHMVSRNASKTAPAKLLVFAIVNGATPIKQPLAKH